jgi:NAD(P)-dependent dehydrogenase (short-subunit alcohol dehydrogenase family)
MSLVLQDRVVVVIGGTSGMGLSAACAIRDAGGRVVAVGRDDEHAERARAELGDANPVLARDACQSATADEAIRLAVREFGALDALYHVAGGSGRKWGDGPIHQVTDEGIQATLQLNLESMLYSNRAAAKWFMQHERGGVVLNMASVLGMSPSPVLFATHVYAAAKAAVIGLTRSCAAYYAPHNIRFNAVAPGLVKTPMATRAANNAEVATFLNSKQPLDGGRIGRPDDLDAAVVFLLSDQSKFVTGQVLGVDGGWSVSEGQLGT